MQNPWFLWALATAALPWWFARRRRSSEPPKTVDFPALFLLTTSKKRIARSRRRRKFLLAATRSTALILGAILGAAPFASTLERETNGAASPTENRTENRTTPNRNRNDRDRAFRVVDGTVDGRPIRVLIVDGADSGLPFPNENARPSPDAERAEPNRPSVPNPPNVPKRSSVSNRPSAAFYVAAALNPTFESPEVSTTQGFPSVERTTSVDFSLLSAPELDVFDAIFWVDLSAPTSEEIVRTERFLKKPGKALVVCAGPRLRIERWNELWTRWNVDAKTIAVELDPATGTPREPIDVERSQAASAVRKSGDELEKTFLAPFADVAKSGVETLPLWRVFPTVGADVVPALFDARSETPVVAKINVANDGGGSVFWVATVPDATASALAFAPIFVPLTERIVEVAVADALDETPQTASTLKTTNDASAKTAKTVGAAKKDDVSDVLWGAFAAVAALEICLAIPSSRRRRTPSTLTTAR